MDHLPTVFHPAYPVLDVPYLFNEDFPYTYDGQGMSDYPSRVGWDTNKILMCQWGQGKTKSAAEAAAFAQSWIYFGLLSDFLGRFFDINDFIHKSESSNTLVKTKTLPNVLELWKDEIESLNSEEQEKFLSKIGPSFLWASAFLAFFSETYPNKPWPLPAEVALSIAILGSTLQLSIGTVAWKTTVSLPTGGFGSTDFVVQRLRQSYCQYDVKWITSTFTAVSQYYLTLLRHREHLYDHTSCSSNQCLALQVDETLYRTKHTEKDCNCPFVQLPASQTSSILRSGGFPVIRSCSDSEATSLTVEVRQWSTGCPVEYVAISHVWANGLGNPKENSLPSCQLARLQQLANNACGRKSDQPHVFFWIDTYCVPVERDRESSARKLAIARMKETYQQALTVLVLDGSLMSQPGRYVDLSETAIRIVTAGWQRRLWTLQEGMLARNLRFQFADDLVDFTEIVSRYSSLGLDPVFAEGAVKCYLYMKASTIFQEVLYTQDAKAWRLGDIINSMQGRSTSHPPDVIICCAVLAGMEESMVTDLIQTAEPQRMLKFVRFYPKIPSQLLFSPGLRLPEYGYRWCPQSFLSSGAHGLFPSTKSLFSRNESGISTQLIGCRVRSTLNKIAPESVTGDSLYYWVKDEIVGRWFVVESDHCWADVLKHPAIVLNRVVLEADGSSLPCVIVDIENEDGPPMVRWHCVCLLQFGTEEAKPTLEMGMSYARVGKLDCDPLRKQEWIFT